MTTETRLPTVLSLDGTWQFVPGPDPTRPTSNIEVPGLWEASGHVALDGIAWYQRTFAVDDKSGRWTLRFGAVMDEAEVFLNGVRVGAHKNAFTPFLFDVTQQIRAGGNRLQVRVTDIERSDPAHARSAHGKQGWMHDVFPSPPSLYMTYGGIWQSVTLRRQGDVRVDDVYVNSNPDDFAVAVELESHPGVVAAVTVEIFGDTIVSTVRFDAERVTLPITIGSVDAARWSPENPVLHVVRVTVRVDDRVSDEHVTRFGLRVVGFSGAGLLVDGGLVKIKSALVQGFRADTLYAEGSRDAIAAEVLAAKDAGLNMLRLHIKAFDPRYLDVCDELGMLVHCDIPVAEPIAHAELSSTGPVADAAAAAADAQVRRDRNHPSIVLWSAMNELGAEAAGAHGTAGYEAFARRLYGVVASADPTRPVIENDWIEPDPQEVFCSALLTAHWYGRLSSEYLTTLSEKTRRWASGDRPLFVSEFGDWGLPRLDTEQREFWAYGPSLTAAIRDSAWTGSVESFVTGTQRYQGLADRLQIEIFRTTPGVVGWCVTELTDVPQEFNGLLDLERNPKAPAIAEIARGTQSALPIVRRTSWTILAGSYLEDRIVIANDGPGLMSARLNVRFGDQQVEVDVGSVESGVLSRPIPIRLRAPEHAGSASLEIDLLDGGEHRASNTYPLHLVGAPGPLGSLTVISDESFEVTLRRLGAVVSADGVGLSPRSVEPADLMVIGEGSLDAVSGKLAGDQLLAGRDVVIFAQTASAASYLPVAAEMADLATEWGSTPFLFTTANECVASLPPQTVLTTEILEATPEVVWTSVGDGTAPLETLVGVLKPYPAQVVGVVVARVRVHAGTLTLCQLPVEERGALGNPLARALIGDVIRYARAPLEVS